MRSFVAAVLLLCAAPASALVPQGARAGGAVDRRQALSTAFSIGAAVVGVTAAPKGAQAIRDGEQSAHVRRTRAAARHPARGARRAVETWGPRDHPKRLATRRPPPAARPLTTLRPPIHARPPAFDSDLPR